MKTINKPFSQIILLASLATSALLANFANAGHLFTQAGSNTPTWIETGTGISIDQYTMETGSGSTVFYFTAPSTTPALADTSNSNWSDWSTGDVLRFTVTTDQNVAFSRSISYDTGTASQYDFCGTTGTSGFTISDSLLSSTNLKIGGSVSSSTNPSVWSVEALAGEFSLSGFRIGFANGRLNGTGAGPLNQQSVVSSSTLSTSPATSPPDINSGKGAYTVTELSNGAVNPVFDGGTLQIASSGVVTTAFVINATGGAIDTNAQDAEFSGALSGVGGLEKKGQGTLTLSTANTYTGNTVITAGKLQIAADNNLGATSASVTLNGGALAITADNSISRAIVVGANHGSIDVASGKTVTASGVVSGAGDLTVTGAGTLVLSGTSTHTGVTNLNSGILALNGTLGSSAIMVAVNTTLMGSGTAQGDVVVDGKAAPGSSPGTLTVAGNFTLNSTSDLNIDVDGKVYSASGGAGSYDRIAVTGTNSVFTAGGTLVPITRGITGVANNNFTPSLGDAFRIVTTANASGIAGVFSAVTQPTSGIPTNRRFDVDYGANSIDLVLAVSSYGTFAQGLGIQNMVNAATALDTIRPSAVGNGTTNTDAFFKGLTRLNEAQVASTLLQASGEVHAFTLADIRASLGEATSTLSQSAKKLLIGDNLWVDVSGYDANYDKDGFASAYQSTQGRIWLGSTLVSKDNVEVGFAFGQSQADLKAGASGSAKHDSLSSAAYWFGNGSGYNYQGALSWSESQLASTRQTALSNGTTNNASKGYVKSLVLDAGLSKDYQLNTNIAGRLWGQGNITLSDAHAFTETGSATTALDVAKEYSKTSQATLGYEISGAVVAAGEWRLGAGSVYTLADGQADAQQRSMQLHGTSWDVTTPHAPRNKTFVSAGINVPLGIGSQFWANVKITQAQGVSMKTGGMGLSMSF